MGIVTSSAGASSPNVEEKNKKPNEVLSSKPMNEDRKNISTSRDGETEDFRVPSSPNRHILDILNHIMKFEIDHNSAHQH